MFPSLVNCCNIDWFTKWPPEALLSVAEQCLKPLGMPDVVSKISRLCVSMHQVSTILSAAKELIQAILAVHVSILWRRLT